MRKEGHAEFILKHSEIIEFYYKEGYPIVFLIRKSEGSMKAFAGN